MPAEAHAVPNAALGHSSAHTGPSPRSKHDAFATQSAGALQASPTATTPSARQARAAPVRPVGGHHAPAGQSAPNGVQIAASSLTETLTLRSPEPTVTM